MGISDAKATDRIFTGVAKFFHDEPKLRHLKIKARDAVSSYLATQLKAGTPATLDHINQVLSDLVPLEMKDYMNGLTPFLNSAKYKIPGQFQVHEQRLKFNSQVTLKSDALDVKFDRMELGTDANARIQYSKANRTLTITKLSDDFVRQLDDVISQE